MVSPVSLGEAAWRVVGSVVVDVLSGPDIVNDDAHKLPDREPDQERQEREPDHVLDDEPVHAAIPFRASAMVFEMPAAFTPPSVAFSTSSASCGGHAVDALS